MDSIAALGQRFDSQILEVRMGFEKTAEGIEERLGGLSKDIKNVIGQLEESVAAKNLEVNNRLNDLESRITALDAITSKKIWKLAAILSLIISLLQVFSII